MPQKDLHQIIVLGNGFDLFCELKSNYKDYFNEHFCFFKKTEIDPKDFEQKSYSQIKEYISKNRKTTEFTWDPIITAWDFVFIHYAANKLDPNNWEDIESILQKWLLNERTSDNKETLESIIPKLAEYKLNYSNPSTSTTSSKLAEILYWYINYYKADIWPQQTISKEELAQSLRENLPKLFFNELKKLEFDFAIYLKRQLNINKYYIDNCIKLYNKISEIDTSGLSCRNSVLSFNYTTPLLHKTIPQSLYTIRNVHGNIPENLTFSLDLLGEPDQNCNIIFGIDEQSAENIGSTKQLQDIIHIFTKTDRKLYLKKQELPENMQKRGLFDAIYNNNPLYSIKVFGHSLGRADYSYFQSIFDEINLYQSPTILYFIGTTRHKVDPEKVYRLINEYGSTLDNRSHGKNLLHKLLIEDRIKIINLDITATSI